MVHMDKVFTKQLPIYCCTKNEVNMMVHLESLVPKSLKEENLLYHMIYFIWFVVYVLTAGVCVDKLLSKLLFTHHRSKSKVNMTVYNQSFIWKYRNAENPSFQRST